MIKTIICDIDGTLIRQDGNCYGQITGAPVLLAGTIEKLYEWERKNFNIILITGRKESTRKITEKQFKKKHRDNKCRRVNTQLHVLHL